MKSPFDGWMFDHGPGDAAFNALLAEAEHWRGRAERAEAQLAAIDRLSEEAWEDGTAVEWVNKIRSGEPLDGMPTQEAYEARFVDGPLMVFR